MESTDLIGQFDPRAVFGDIAMNGAMRSIAADIRAESNRLYDLTLYPDQELTEVSELLSSELRHCGFGDIDPEEVRGCILTGEGRQCVKNLVSSYFGPCQPEDMSASDLLDLHIRLTAGLGRPFDSGRVRQGDHPIGTDRDGSEPHIIGIDPALSMSRMVTGYVSSAYDPLVSSILLYGGLRAICPFDGDSRLFYSEVLRKSLCASGLWGFRYSRLSEAISRSESEIRLALPVIMSDGGMSRFVELMLRCLFDSIHESYVRLDDLDVKRTLTGVEGATERAIIRLARTRPDFQMSEALYLGDCAPQAFRKRLNYLVSIGIIEKTGRTRGSRYRIVDPFDPAFDRYGGTRMHMGMVVGTEPQKAQYRSRHLLYHNSDVKRIRFIIGTMLRADFICIFI